MIDRDTSSGLGVDTRDEYVALVDRMAELARNVYARLIPLNSVSGTRPSISDPHQLRGPKEIGSGTIALLPILAVRAAVAVHVQHKNI